MNFIGRLPQSPLQHFLYLGFGEYLGAQVPTLSFRVLELHQQSSRV